jgi:RNA polymerase sigma-70 factor (ECF subfamily)
MKDVEMRLKLSFAPLVQNTFSFLKKEKAVSAASFRGMLEPVKKNLYNFIFKALNFSEDADDVFQETVLRALKYINSFKSNSSFKTWIFTIAHNEIKGYYKKNNDKSKIVPGAQWGENFAEDIAANNDCAEKELIKNIYEIAAGLKPKQRKVFFLFYENKFSIKEISGITGLKEGNIKFILNRCRRIIKEELGVKDEK